MHEDYKVRCGAKELGVTRTELQRAIDKVGNSATAVRKELDSYRAAATSSYATASRSRGSVAAPKGLGSLRS
jgi:hypothetical protein